MPSVYHNGGGPSGSRGVKPVDIYSTNKPFNQRTKELVAQTHPHDGPIIVNPLSKRFGVDIDPAFLAGKSLQFALDGIGTAAKIEWDLDRVDVGARNASAMVLDDLIESNHRPVVMCDHIQVHEEDRVKIRKIIGTLVAVACENPWTDDQGAVRPIVVPAGETAVINTLDGFEVGITGVGVAKKEHLVTQNAVAGDVLIGIASSGVHSNGFSFLRREIASKGIDFDVGIGSETLGEALTTPTRLYLRALSELLDAFAERGGRVRDFVHGMAHVTGGGLVGRVRDLLPKSSQGASISIDLGDSGLAPQEIFTFANEALGMDVKKMYETFNMGIGYVLAVPPSEMEFTLKVLSQWYKTRVIGSVVEEPGRTVRLRQYAFPHSRDTLVYPAEAEA